MKEKEESENKYIHVNFPFIKLKNKNVPNRIQLFVKRHPVVIEFLEYHAITTMFIIMFISCLVIPGFSVTGKITSASLFSNFNGLFILNSKSEGFMVVFASLMGLLIAMVSHELGHILSILNNDKKIHEYGVIFFIFFPIFAYVDSDKEKTCREVLTIYSMGVFFNILVSFVVLFIFYLPITTSFSSVFFHYTGLLFSSNLEISRNNFMLFEKFIFWIYIVNLNLAIFNSLPVSRLDGGKIIRKIIEKNENNLSKKITLAGFTIINLLIITSITLIIVYKI